MKQIMRVKDMFLKNKKFLICLFTIIHFLFSYNAYSNTEDKTQIINYLGELQNFSASFLQNDGENLSEGKVYIGNKRIRVEYLSPVKILIILDNNKAMYYNYELEEDEFFNPKNTNAWFFYDIFRNPLFFQDAEIEFENNELQIKKIGFDSENKKYFIKVLFENNPFVLRKVEVSTNQEYMILSIYNHNYNEQFNRDFFKLINPNLLN